MFIEKYDESFTPYMEYLMLFKKPISEAFEEYQANYPIQKDSWENCDINILESKLKSNVNDFFYKDQLLLNENDKRYRNRKCLIDIINFAMMLFVRIDELGKTK